MKQSQLHNLVIWGRVKPSDFQMDVWTPMFITCVDEMLPITMVTCGY